MYFFDKYDPILNLGLATCMHFELLFSLFIRMSRDLLINKMRKSNYQKIQQIQKLNPIHCWKNLARKRRKNLLSEKGRKCTWKESLVNDLVDRILENDTYRKSCY